MKTVQTAFILVLVTSYFLEIWSLQMQPVSSKRFSVISSVTNTSHVYYQGHFMARRIMSMKNSSDTIGNQTCDLLVYSAMPQPSAPPRAPLSG